jgi:serine protease
VALASIWFAAHPGTGISQAPDVEPPVQRLIVKFRDAKDTALERAGRPMVQVLGERMGVALGPLHQRSGGVQVLLPPAGYTRDEVRRLARELAREPEVAYAEPDARRYVRLTPIGEPEFVNQRYLSDPSTGLNTQPAWDVTIGSYDNVVAVVDTGVLPDHQDLNAQLGTGYDFVSADPDGRFDTAGDGDGRDDDPSDPGDWVTAGACGPGDPPQNLPSSWHGTRISSLIGAAQNGIGMVGVNWQVSVLPVRAVGRCGGFVSDINDALRWAAGLPVPGVPDNPNPARIINLSVGAPGACLQSEQAAIDDARAAGALVVVAAGNETRNALRTAPANCHGVLVVTATGQDGGLADFSDFGVKVGLSAPGMGILTAANKGFQGPEPSPGADDWNTSTGTSFAAPLVAGVAALMLAVDPALSMEQLIGTLRAEVHDFPTVTGIQCSDPLCGTGIADADNAAAAVQVGQITSEAQGDGLAAAFALAQVADVGTPIPGNLTQDAQMDFYRLKITQAQAVAIGTAGITDTYGYLFDAGGKLLDQDDDRSVLTDTNFEIRRDLSPGTYFIAVEGFARTTRGPYALSVSLSAQSSNGGGGGGGMGWPALLGLVAWWGLRAYPLVRRTRRAGK